MGYGIRVVLVMNRKGGSGKSTLCRALASAAAARGETVTIFDTDASKSCLTWMQAGKEAGNWSPLVEVIHTLDALRVAEAIGQIYEQPDQEHLILIDTFGGGSEAQDVLAVAAHRIICPMMLSRGDLSETLETANWYLKLRGRVEKPGELAGFSVLLNRVPVRVSETERAVAEELFQSLPALEIYLGSRAAYVRMDTHLATTAFVEDRNPGLESGAMLGESRPRHCAGEDEMCGFGQAGEGLGPGRGIWRETRTRDGDQPPTRGQPGKRRAQMPGRRLGRPTIDVGHGREWRVHQDDAWAHARVEMIVNLCSVKASDRAAREQQSQKVDAGVCQLVQCKAAARDLNQDRQKAGPSRRLEDQVTGSDLRSREGHEPHGQRRRELLESLHLLRAPGVRGQEARHLGEDGQQRCRRASPSQQRTAEFPQEEDKCHLARFIGQFPIPSAHRIGVAEGTLHLEAQAQRVDLESLRQIGLQGLGHGKDPGRRIRQDRNNDRRQHGRDQRLEGHQNTSGWGKR